MDHSSQVFDPGTLHCLRADRSSDRFDRFAAALLPSLVESLGFRRRRSAQVRSPDAGILVLVVGHDMHGKPAGERGGEILEHQRLGQMSLHTGYLRSEHIFWVGIRGQGDDRQAPGGDTGGADGARSGIAVAARHLDIHQHQVEGRQLPEIRRHRFDRSHAVMRQRDLLPEVLEHGGHEHAVHVMVFGKQDAALGRHFNIGGSATTPVMTGRRSFHFDKRNAQGEARSDSGHGIDAQRPAEQFCQLA